MSPLPASQRPVSSAPGSPPAVNVPAAEIWTVALRRPGRWPVYGYHALYADSFAENSTRSQGIPGLAALSSASQARSAAPATDSSNPPASARHGSASMPTAATSGARATAQARYPGQCVMLPTTPSGHRGSPARPGSTGPASTPNRASAVRATARPAANSARRSGSAVATAAASAGNSSRSPGGPKDSAATAPAG